MSENSTRTFSRPMELLSLVAILSGPLAVLAMHLWPRLAIHATEIFLLVGVIYTVVIATVVRRSMKPSRRRLMAMIGAGVVFLGSAVGFVVWREGHVVATAEFNPGVAPFEVTVREVPVRVTHSHHFIVTLWRGQYPVTSFRYFWLAYTPSHIRIRWPRLDTFTVSFDDRYVATCHWSWGAAASWTMEVPPGGLAPGDRP